MNTLVQHNETYLNLLFEDIKNHVQGVCENESYSEIQVNNLSELDRNIKYYGIELNQEVTEFPAFLPFSQTVISVNDIIKNTISNIFAY